MKNFKSVLLTMAVSIAGLAQALTIEVLPYKLEAGVEVMGVQAKVSAKGAAQDAVILSGAAANQVAKIAGLTVDTTTQALLLTGKEVNNLVVDALVGVDTAGRAVFINSLVFADRAMGMTLGVLETGAYTVVAVGEEMTETAANLTRAIYRTAGNTVLLVGETGAVVLSTGANILGSTMFLIGDVISNILGGIFGF